MKNAPKEERVSARVTSRHKKLMEKYDVTVSDLCDFYFSSFGTDKKRQEIELVCTNNRIADLELELLALRREKENLEKSLGTVSVKHAVKTIDSVNEKIRSNRRRMRRLNKGELEDLRKRKDNK